MSENNIEPTNNKLKVPRNNVRKTGGYIDPNKMRRDMHRMQNDVTRMSRRDYIAKTIKAGVDEFNDTPIRAQKGGPAHTTGAVAKFNKGRLIKASAKPTFRGGVVGLGLSIVDTLGASGLLGSGIQKASQDFDAAKEEAYNAGAETWQSLTGQ